MKIALAFSLLVATTAFGEPTAPPAPPTPPTAPEPPAPPEPPVNLDARRAAADAARAEADAARAVADAKEAAADAADEAADEEDDGGKPKLALKVDINSDDGDRDGGVASTVVPVSFFLMVAAIFGMAQLARLRREQRLHDTLRLAIERGVDLDLSGVLPAPRNDRRRGVLLAAFGAGLFGFLFFADGLDSAGLGLVPLLIGLGYLTSDVLDRR